MRLWRDSNFLKLWCGQTISEIGSRVSREGLPFTAVRMLGASEVQMGLLAALGGVTTLVAGPLAGLVADRYRRKPLMIVADLGRAAALGCVPLAAFTGHLSLALLFVVVTIAGILTVFFDVAYQSMVPSLVQPEQLGEANSKLALTASTAEVVGPAMTGVLVQVLTAPRAILLDAISFLVSALSIALMSNRETERVVAHEESAWADIKEGLRYVFSHSILRPLALRTATYSVFGGFFWATYMLFALRDLHIGPAVLGVVIAMGGISNFTGAVLAGHVHRWFRVGTILIASTILSGMVTLLLPLAYGPVMGAVVLGAAQLLGDIFYPLYAIQELTLRQQITPPALLGRVNACNQMLFKGIVPIGALLGGLLAHWFGIRWTLATAGFGIIASSLWLIFSGVRSR